MAESARETDTPGVASRGATGREGGTGDAPAPPLSLPPSGYLETSAGQLEYAWHGPAPESSTTLVFLHEGLGSLSRWRDLPADLARETGTSALVYSRAGYGRSAPVALPRPVDFMHREAQVLAEVLRRTGVREAVLIGHSDGASIAIIYAANTPAIPVRGLALEAPHVFVEDIGVASIAAIAQEYHASDLPTRLAKHHGANTEVAFWGWNRVWLDPGFRAWNIEPCLASIRVPILILQGEDDQYGTWRQVEAIERQAGGPVRSIRLSGCGHAPHRDRPEAVTPAMIEFVRGITRGTQSHLETGGVEMREQRQ